MAHHQAKPLWTNHTITERLGKQSVSVFAEALNEMTPKNWTGG